MEYGPVQVVDHGVAAEEQITDAIRLFRGGRYASAITLALAAETHLPPTSNPTLFNAFRRLAPEKIDDLNLVRNWLKHHRDPPSINLYEFEVVISIVRAMTHYFAVYGRNSPDWQDFKTWSLEYLNERRPGDA